MSSYTARTAIGLLTWAVSCQPLHAADADEILKSMSDYLASREAFSASFNSSVEVITTGLEKIQFTNSGEIAVRRPNRMHSMRTGGYVVLETVYDGSSLVLHTPSDKKYARRDAPGSIDELVAELEEGGYALPGADLLLSDVYAALSGNVLEAKHVGLGVINGVECEHLAFRNADFDWQLWVQSGDRPIPCKYVISNKSVTGSPQYSITIADWQESTDDTFTFVPPAGTLQVDEGDLPHLDEIPQGESK